MFSQTNTPDVFVGGTPDVLGQLIEGQLVRPLSNTGLVLQQRAVIQCGVAA
jgi:hypothetical protein